MRCALRVTTPRELGGFLKQARIDRRLTQAQLAEKLNVRRQRVLYLERGDGQISVPFVFSVLQVLGVALHLTGGPEGEAVAITPTVAAPYSIDEIADGVRK